MKGTIMAEVGIVGWRGMVGSVLTDRMIAEDDFEGFEPLFASTSQAGQRGPEIGKDTPVLKNAFDLEVMKKMDVIVTCQGSDYTKDMYPKLRQAGWDGYWIDAASALRMDDDAIIVLDPINRDVIDNALAGGIKKYIGGNCTVSLMLMALGGLFKNDLVEWVTSMTYQAASGAGAKNMRELVAQMQKIGDEAKDIMENPSASALTLDKNVIDTMRGSQFPVENFGAPLAGNVLPWIDKEMENGQSREEWKGFAEANKILGTDTPIPVDGICVRIGSMRCHSQALTIKLKKDVSVEDIEKIVDENNEWVRLIPNNKADSLEKLTPAAVTGTLQIPIGRIRKMNVGPQYLTAFTVGDQLLWGAAEPIRRILNIVLAHIG
jgi:aspartate-semialdehyde dehydrogenase